MKRDTHSDLVASRRCAFVVKAGVGTKIVSDLCVIWRATALLLSPSFCAERCNSPINDVGGAFSRRLCTKSIAAALDPSLDVVDGAFPVASAIDIWARDPPAVSAVPARNA